MTAKIILLPLPLSLSNFFFFLFFPPQLPPLLEIPQGFTSQWVSLLVFLTLSASIARPSQFIPSLRSASSPLLPSPSSSMFYASYSSRIPMNPLWSFTGSPLWEVPLVMVWIRILSSILPAQRCVLRNSSLSFSLSLSSSANSLSFVNFPCQGLFF